MSGKFAARRTYGLLTDSIDLRLILGINTCRVPNKCKICTVTFQLDVSAVFTFLVIYMSLI
jgi:hypothetical protein